MLHMATTSIALLALAIIIITVVASAFGSPLADKLHQDKKASSSSTSPCTFTSVSTDNAPNNISLALNAAAGIINRQGPVLYLTSDYWGRMWQKSLIEANGCTPNTPANPYHYMASLFTTGTLTSIILYDGTINGTVSPMLPSVITMCGVKSAVPLDAELYQHLQRFGVKGDVVLDTRGLWHDQYDAVNWTIDNGLDQTNGYSFQSASNMQAGTLVDFIIHRQQFAHALPNACEGGTRGNAILMRMADLVPKNKPGWKPPVVVSGYNAEDPLFGGDMFEAESDCHVVGKKLGLGQMASAGTRNLAFLSMFRRFNLSAPRGSEFGPLKQAQVTKTLAPYNTSKTYIAIVYGDNDNLDFVSSFTQQHMEEWRSLYAEPGRKKWPLSWTMSPWAFDVFPSMLRWYHEQAASIGNDEHWEFMFPPSGFSYSYPSWFDESVQKANVAGQNEIANIYDASSSVLWDWFFNWDADFKEYLPRYESVTPPGTRQTKNFFLNDVPWPFQVVMPPFPKYDAIVGDPASPSTNVAAIRPCFNWQVGGGGGFNPSPAQAADLVEKLPAGSASYVYMIQNGSPRNLFEMVDNITSDRVVILKAADLGEIVRQKAAQESRNKKKH